VKYLVLLLVTSCVAMPPTTDFPPQGFKGHFPVQAWNDYTYMLVKNSKLVTIKASDEKAFCPNGMSAANWTHLITAVAKRESNHKPALEYKESFKNSKGEYIISTGLLQISLESSKGYNCGMTSQADLKDPYKNIACGVKIFERWLERDKVLSKKVGSQWTGAIARYHSVGRDSLPKTKEVLKPWCE